MQKVIAIDLSGWKKDQRDGLSVKVLHVLPSMSLHYGGPVQAVLGMTRALEKNGIKNTICSSRFGLDEFPASTSGVDGLEKISFPSKGNSFLPRDFGFSPGLSIWVKKTLREFDLVHIHGLFTHPTSVSCKIARVCQIPYIIRPCGMLDPWSLKRSPIRKSMWMAFVERKNLDAASAIHFTSRNEQALAAPLNLKSRGTVLPIGVEMTASREDKDEHDLSFERPPVVLGKKTILFVSRLHPKKGLDRLVVALHSLAKKRDDFAFLIAGSGTAAYEEKMKQLVRLHGLSSRTHFLGFVQGDDKKTLFNQSDIFVLPSSQENFGIAVAEAMGAGLPVVVSDRVNICDDILSYRAGLVTSLTPDDMAAAIEKLLDDAELRRTMGENGRRLVLEKYNWDLIIPELIRVYEKIIAGKTLDE